MFLFLGALFVGDEGWNALYELLNKFDHQTVLTEATVAITVLVASANHGMQCGKQNKQINKSK